jgi:uncharacterized tellurite resistance protein B-like protein
MSTLTEHREMLFEVMTLMLLADKEVKSEEIAKISSLLAARPEFEGLDTTSVAEGIESAVVRAQKLHSQEKFDDRLAEISQKLGTKENRLIAFGMAAAVALADDELHPDELRLLSIFEKAFNLSNEEVNGVVRCIKSGRSFDSIFPTHQDERVSAYIETLVIALGADGQVSRAEIQVLSEMVDKSPELQGINMQQADAYIQRALDALHREGLEARLSLLGRSLESTEERFEAFCLALRMIAADGEVTREERHLLARLEAIFDMSKLEVKRAIARIDESDLFA